MELLVYGGAVVIIASALGYSLGVTATKHQYSDYRYEWKLRYDLLREMHEREYAMYKSERQNWQRLVSVLDNTMNSLRLFHDR